MEQVVRRKKRFNKKLISVLLLVVIILITSISGVFSALASGNVVMHIFSYTESNLRGHSWIYIENNTSSSITVGHYSLAGGDAVSIGTWGNLNDGKGIYYNAEAYKNSSANYTSSQWYSLSAHERWDGRVSISTVLSSSQLSDVTNEINSRDKWTTFNNCASFAVAVWNAGSSLTLTAGLINRPRNVTIDIIDKAPNTYLTNDTMMHKGTAYKHKSSGHSSVSSSVYTQLRTPGSSSST